MISRLLSRIRHEQAQANEQFMVCPHCHQWGKFGRCGVCGFDAGNPQAVTQLRAERASSRARQRAFWQQTYALCNSLFHFHAADFEAMGQIGAVIGPLIVAGVLAINGDYRTALAVLLAPALVALAVLVVARLAYPHPSDLEAAGALPQAEGLTRSFWIYLAAASLIAAGYADYPLIAFHFEQSGAAVRLPV